MPWLKSKLPRELSVERKRVPLRRCCAHCISSAALTDGRRNGGPGMPALSGPQTHPRVQRVSFQCRGIPPFRGHGAVARRSIPERDWGPAAPSFHRKPDQGTSGRGEGRNSAVAGSCLGRPRARDELDRFRQEHRDMQSRGILLPGFQFTRRKSIGVSAEPRLVRQRFETQAAREDCRNSPELARRRNRRALPICPWAANDVCMPSRTRSSNASRSISRSRNPFPATRLPPALFRIARVPNSTVDNESVDNRIVGNVGC